MGADSPLFIDFLQKNTKPYRTRGVFQGMDAARPLQFGTETLSDEINASLMGGRMFPGSRFLACLWRAGLSMMGIAGLIVAAGCANMNDPMMDQTPAPHIIFQPFRGTTANYWFEAAENPTPEQFAHLMADAQITLAQRGPTSAYSTVRIDPSGEVLMVYPLPAGDGKSWQVTRAQLTDDALAKIRRLMLDYGFVDWPLGITSRHVYRASWTPQTPEEAAWRGQSALWREQVNTWMLAAEAANSRQQAHIYSDSSSLRESISERQDRLVKDKENKKDQDPRKAQKMERALDRDKQELSELDSQASALSADSQRLADFRSHMAELSDAEYDTYFWKEAQSLRMGMIPPPPPRPDIPDYVRPDGTIDRYDFSSPLRAGCWGTWAVVSVKSSGYSRSSAWESTFTYQLTGLFANVEMIVLDPVQCRLIDSRTVIVDASQLVMPGAMPVMNATSTTYPAASVPATMPPVTTQPVTTQPVR